MADTGAGARNTIRGAADTAGSAWCGAQGRRALRADLVRALPLVALAYPYAAIGESIGYLAGLGDTDRSLQRSLLETRREQR